MFSGHGIAIDLLIIIIVIIIKLIFPSGNLCLTDHVESQRQSPGLPFDY